MSAGAGADAGADASGAGAFAGASGGAFDAVVIGGGYAGMAAALQLARARRRVAVIDAGLRRNRFAGASHGVLGMDGVDAGEIAATARAQLLRYPSVRWIEDEAVSAAGRLDDFTVQTGAGEALRARRLVLATGVRDLLPPIEGLAARWGSGVLHCPYCHGYELEGAPTAFLAQGPEDLRAALLVCDWGPCTVLTNGAFAPDAAMRSALEAAGAALEPAPILRIEGAADVVLRGGAVLRVAALFLRPRTEPASPIAAQLGVAQGAEGRILVNGDGCSSAPGVYACGDGASASQTVSLAIGGGAWVGMRLHKSLLM